MTASGAGKFLTRDEILGVSDDVMETVQVPEWGGAVCVKSLSGFERDRFETAIYELKGKKAVVKDNVRANLVSLVVVAGPENPTPIFTAKDVEALGKKNAAALNRVYEVAAKLSGLTDADVEELVGN